MFSFLMIQVSFSVVYNILRELQYYNFRNVTDNQEIKRVKYRMYGIFKALPILLAIDESKNGG